MLQNIRCIEVEIHSFCNRVCQWCPNRIISRNKHIEMGEAIYLSLLYELRFNKYSGVISYSRYNEPMANIQLFKKRLLQAKKILPNTKLVSNTNGDYINKKNLQDLKIDELTVMDYDGIGLDKCKERLLNAGCKIVDITYPFIKAKFDDITILYYLDWAENAQIVDRGGILNKDDVKMDWLNDLKPRDYPCFEPQYFVGVDYTGDVTPCCQIRSDNKAHSRFILGNIKRNSLENILNSPRAKSFRKATITGNYEQEDHPCKYCQKEPGRYTDNNPGINY